MGNHHSSKKNTNKKQNLKTKKIVESQEMDSPTEEGRIEVEKENKPPIFLNSQKEEILSLPDGSESESDLDEESSLLALAKMFNKSPTSKPTALQSLGAYNKPFIIGKLYEGDKKYTFYYYKNIIAGQSFLSPAKKTAKLNEVKNGKSYVEGEHHVHVEETDLLGNVINQYSEDSIKARGFNPECKYGTAMATYQSLLRRCKEDIDRFEQNLSIDVQHIRAAFFQMQQIQGLCFGLLGTRVEAMLASTQVIYDIYDRYLDQCTRIPMRSDMALYKMKNL